VSRTPEPRPALRRAHDGSVHPAAPRATPEKHLHPAPSAPAAAVPEPEPVPQPVEGSGPFKPGDLRARKAAKPPKSGKGKKAEETVPLEVRIPKKLRKALRKRANADNVVIDDVVTDSLSAWLDS
jgi:hypothetical protein